MLARRSLPSGSPNKDPIYTQKEGVALFGWNLPLFGQEQILKRRKQEMNHDFSKKREEINVYVFILRLSSTMRDIEAYQLLLIKLSSIELQCRVTPVTSIKM